MKLFALPWLELSIAISLLGAVCVRLFRDVRLASKWCLTFITATLGCIVMAVGAYFSHQASPTLPWGLGSWNGQRMLAVDELNALLLPLVAMLHFLTALTTSRMMMAKFSFAGLLVGAAVRLAAFSCVASWLLVALLALEFSLPLFSSRKHVRPSRVYLVHALLFVVLLGLGWACIDNGGMHGLGSVLIVLAVLIRTGIIPTQVWVTELFDRGSFTMALLLTAPLAGVYAMVRLVLPAAPEWVLEGLGIVALASAVYSAGMGMVQTDSRRFFAYLLSSHAALVLVGLGLHTPFAVTGALVMWLSSALSLTGMGLALRAVEARVGALYLTEYRGLYEQTPSLAVIFLITGLAAVGFPGTTGFVAIELLVDEAVGTHVAVGLVVVLVAALNGIAIVRAYLLLFTGNRHVTGVSLGITPRERMAELTLVLLIIGGGLFPQTYLESRYRAVEAILRDWTKSTDSGHG